MQLWLLAGCVLIMAMISIGAITRLTGSGLSIVEWDVVTGTVPPLNHAEWEKAFREYKQSPQYKDVNSDMDLASFKSIFWWEYVHRLLGRFIGMFFIFQLALFLLPKAIEQGNGKKIHNYHPGRRCRGGMGLVHGEKRFNQCAARKPVSSGYSFVAGIDVIQFHFVDSPRFASSPKVIGNET